jgi:hypothetical protein
MLEMMPEQLALVEKKAAGGDLEAKAWLAKYKPYAKRLGQTYKSMEQALNVAAEFPQELREEFGWEESQMERLLHETGTSRSALLSLNKSTADVKAPKYSDRQVETYEKQWKEASEKIDDFKKSIEKATRITEDYAENTKETSGEQKQFSRTITEQRKSILRSAEGYLSIIEDQPRIEKLAEKGLIDKDELTKYRRAAVSAADKLEKFKDQFGRTQDIEEQGPYGAIGDRLKRVLGGFGLFYTTRLASLGLGAFKTGFEEREQYEMALAQTQLQMYGAGGYESYAPLAYSQQRASILSGGGAYGALQRSLQPLSGFAEIGGSLLAGASTTALVSHIAPFFGGAEEFVKNKLAPGLGILAGVGMMASSMYQNYQDYDNSLVRAAAQGSQGGWIGDISAFYTGFGPSMGTAAENWNILQSRRDELSEGQQWILDKKFIPRGIRQLLIGDRTGFEEDFFARRSELEERTRQLREGELSLWDITPGNRMSRQEITMMAKTLGLSPGEDLEHLSAQTITQGVLTLGTATEQLGTRDIANIIGQVGAAQEAGIPVQEMARITAAIGGKPLLTSGDIYLRAQPIAQMTASEQTRLQAGLGLMGQIPGGLREFYGYSDEQIREMAGGAYADIAGGRYEDYFLQAKSTQEQLRQMGIEYDVDKWNFVSGLTWSKEEEQKFITDQAFRAAQASVGQQFMSMGISSQAVGQMVSAATNMGGTQFLNRLAQFEPRAFGQAYQEFINQGLYEQASIASPIAALANYDMATGMPTTQGMFRTSMVNPIGGLQDLSTQLGRQQNALANAQRIWGTGWQQTAGGRAAVYGINTRTGEIYDTFQAGDNIRYGEQALAWAQLYQSYENQQKSLGSSYAMLALQEEYMPKFWDIQDRQRALGHRQQLWQFEQQEWQLGFSERQMEMGARQWQERSGLQRKQDVMQRQWAMEDWAYQDQTRSLQWGWQQEDFAENIRFMTGRERRLAERQMERQTTMYNLETGQIETQRSRQEEIWALQDERFDMETRHHQEQLEMQEEALEKQREQLEMQKQFYEERRKLEEESIQLSREYQTKQLELQKAALGNQAEQLENQFEMQKLQLELNEAQEETMDKAKQLQQESAEFFNNLIGGLGNLEQAFMEMIENISAKADDPTGDYGTNWNKYIKDNDWGNSGWIGGDNPMPQQEGGDWFAGGSYVVGERGLELARPGTIGSVVNQYDVAQFIGQQDKWSSRSVFHPTQRGVSGDGSSGPQTINVYIGNEKLASFVLNTVKNDLEVLG